MTAQDHNKLLGVFFLILGGLLALGGLFAGVTYGGVGAAILTSSSRSDEQTVGGIFIGVAFAAVFILIALSVFYLLTGWKVYKGKSGARTLGIVASCLSLLSFPLGTALGVYGLWFFFGDEGKCFYNESGSSRNMFNVPPPPNHWQ